MRKVWRKIAVVLTVLAAAAVLGGCTSAGRGEVSAPNGGSPGLAEILSALEGALSEAEEQAAEEMRTVWIAYLDLVPLLQEQEEAAFSQAFSDMAENCLQAGFNTLVVQVRPFGDSFYPSAYFSWSSMTGELPYDPMEVMTRISGEKGLSFHAWINPMRAMTEAEAADVPESFPIRQWYDDPALRAERLILLDGRIYLNPASEEVRQLIAGGAAELAENYSIDGVHIDDYFYPPALDFSADAGSYAAYCGEGGTLSQEDWRRDNTLRMVREISSAVKKANPAAQFGISPRGVLSQNTDELFVDLEQIVQEPGCLDYLAPQLYYGFDNESAPFSRMAAEWNALAEQGGIPLIAGLAAYKVGGEDLYAGTGKTEWQEDLNLLAAQITEARSLSAYGGVMLFRYGSIFQPEEERQAAMKEAMETFLPLLQE